MSTTASLLTPTQQATAHRYWHTLLFPESSHDLHSARRGLKNEESPVVEAVMNALAVVWDRDRDPFPEENPFAVGTGGF